MDEIDIDIGGAIRPQMFSFSRAFDRPIDQSRVYERGI
jgi:hypothetical protein